MEGVLSKGRCLILALAIVFFSSSWLLDGLETVNLQDLRSLQSLKQAWGSSTVLWSGPDPCADKWEGILCEDNRVVSLYLVNKELKGTIPPAIGDLTALQNLDLSFNGNLQGTLPDELGKLTSLEYL
ncbi:probable leucine-rich repeat receptor-like protein kinase At5g49770 [Physcomitrium patens]